MKQNLIFSFLLALTTVMALLVVAQFSGTDSQDAPDLSASETQDLLVRNDSRRISDAPSGSVEFVEFLDFECEACRAAHPAVTELRERYGDQVSFVVRNFPLHANSEAAAQAAEAAAEQGFYVEMIDLLFETQPEWGEKRSSQDEVFFGLAEQLGLDMDRFRSDFDDPASLELIRRDKADGLALGVQGTPTFFLDGQMLQPRSFDDLVAAFDEVLAR